MAGIASCQKFPLQACPHWGVLRLGVKAAASSSAWSPHPHPPQHHHPQLHPPLHHPSCTSSCASSSTSTSSTSPSPPSSPSSPSSSASSWSWSSSSSSSSSSYFFPPPPPPPPPNRPPPHHHHHHPQHYRALSSHTHSLRFPASILVFLQDTEIPRFCVLFDVLVNHLIFDFPMILSLLELSSSCPHCREKEQPLCWAVLAALDFTRCPMLWRSCTGTTGKPKKNPLFYCVLLPRSLSCSSYTPRNKPYQRSKHCLAVTQEGRKLWTKT